MIRRGLVASAVAAGIGLVGAYALHRTTVGMVLMIPAPPPFASTPAQAIRAGVPYLQRDGAVTQLCISNRDAHSLPPYVEGP